MVEQLEGDGVHTLGLEFLPGLLPELDDVLRRLFAFAGDATHLLCASGCFRSLASGLRGSYKR